jgi:ATP-dependent Clp endopeptidase proteolytic subunit ClpP
MGKQVFGQLTIFDPVQNFAGGGETARVELYGAIGWEVYADEFLQALNALPESVGDIDLRIHSYGGSVTEGWAIAQALKNHRATVTGTVEGTAASMASVIAMSCDRLVMAENSYLMIHRVSGGAFGDAEDMENAARTVRQLESDIVDFYASKTGIASEEIREMMAAETWLNGKEALEKGFCHEVAGEVQAVALVGEKAIVEKLGSLPGPVAEAHGIQNEPTAKDAKEAKEVEETDEETDKATDEGTDEGAGAPEEVQEVPETAVESLLGKVKNLFGGSADGRAQNVAALTAENSRLIAEGETLRADLAAAVMERDEFRERLQTLETEARKVEAVIAECGFSPAEAESLPGPSDDDGEASAGSAANVLDQFRSMPKGEARSAFFRENEDEIFRLKSAEGKKI